MEKLPYKFQYILTQGKIVTGNSRAFIGTSDAVKEVQIGDRPVRYLTSEEYNALSDGEKMKEIAYMVPEMNQELADYHYSNPNLLINADFRCPVNQIGKTSYSGNGYGIDRWLSVGYGTVTLTDGGINISTPEDKHLYYNQYLNRNDINDIALTYSILLGDGTLHYATGTISSGIIITDISTGWCSVVIEDGKARAQFDVLGNNTFVAAKLEIGDTQTLAHKEGDTWVLNDIPNYWMQYALCAQYSPYNGNWIGYSFHNENLLDNWYFVDPINQRAIQSGEAWGSGYGFDRWRAFVDGITSWVENSGVHLAAGSNSIIESYIERTRLVPNAYYTLSFLLSDTLHCMNFINDSSIEVQYGFSRLMDDNCLLSILLNRTGEWCIRLWNQSGQEKIVLAAKLEIGDTQTLAHKEGDTWVLNDPLPNKATELMKCQRYLVVYNTSDCIGETLNVDSKAFFSIAKPNMRAIPTLVKNGATFDCGIGNDVTVSVNDLQESSSAHAAAPFMTIASDIPVTRNYPLYVKYDSPAQVILSAEL